MALFWSCMQTICVRRAAVVIVIVPTILARHLLAQEKAPVSATIVCETDGPIPFGAPVLVSVRLRNEGDTGAFTVTRTGLPMFMSKSTRNNATGEEVPGRTDGWVVDRFGLGTKSKSTYIWRRGSEFVVRYDLCASVVFPGPGRYTVQVKYAQRDVATAEFTIAPALSESVSGIVERCAHPSGGLSLDDFRIEVKAELRTGKVAVGDGAEKWYAQVTKVRAEDERTWYGSMLLECPPKGAH